MAARDKIHPAVCNALLKDGWEITDDPLTIRFKEIFVMADLGAERTIGAMRGSERIAVEIKTFGGRSPVFNLENALGQYNLYQGFLEATEPERTLYLAISREVHQRIFNLEAVRFIIQRYQVKILVIDIVQEEIVTWIK